MGEHMRELRTLPQQLKKDSLDRRPSIRFFIGGTGVTKSRREHDRLKEKPE